MTQNITKRIDKYTYMKQTHLKCYHGLQIPVFWEGALELYQEDTYVHPPYPYTEETRLPFQKSEHKYPQQHNINWYNTKYPRRQVKVLYSQNQAEIIIHTNTQK